MYLYAYAPFLRQKKYARDLALIEGRITDFGIGGKVTQLSQFLKFPSALKEFGMKRLTTLVLVGDDMLLDEAVNYVALSNVVIGYIPIGESVFGEALSIPQGAEAVQTLAARKIERIDLGRVENRLFLGTLRVEGSGLELHSMAFSLFPKGLAVLEIVNLRQGFDAADGALDVILTPVEGVLRKKPKTSTHIRVNSCRLKAASPLAIRVGAHGLIKTPFQIDIAPKAIRIIGGRTISGSRSKQALRKK